MEIPISRTNQFYREFKNGTLTSLIYVMLSELGHSPADSSHGLTLPKQVCTYLTEVSYKYIEICRQFKYELCLNDL